MYFVEDAMAKTVSSLFLEKLTAYAKPKEQAQRLQRPTSFKFTSLDIATLGLDSISSPEKIESPIVIPSIVEAESIAAVVPAPLSTVVAAPASGKFPLIYM